MLKQLDMIGPGPGLISGPVFVCFELAGEPRGKGRHRSKVIVPKDGKPFAQMYPDPATVAYEEALAWVARAAMGAKPITEAPLAVLIHAFKLVPVSWTRKDRDRALGGTLPPTGKPDGDNYMKIVGDALNGIVWKDDAAIVDWRIIKRYSENPAMRVEVREMVLP